MLLSEIIAAEYITFLTCSSSISSSLSDLYTGKMWQTCNTTYQTLMKRGCSIIMMMIVLVP